MGNRFGIRQKHKQGDLFYPKRLTLYNEIYIGHTPVSRIGKTTPVQMSCIWNVDTGAAFKGPLTIMMLIPKNSGKVNR